MHAFDTLGGFKAAVHQSIVDHYQLAGPLMEALFGGTPLVYVVYPRGLGNYAVYHGALHTPAPAHLRTIDVPQAQGLTTYIAFAPRAVEWLLAHTSTVEFHGWGCAAEDPTIARFGRILLELDREHGAPLIEAVHVVRERLREAGLQAVPLLQSTRGLALWIPLAGVRYAPLLGWLNAFCAAVARDNPLLFSLEPNTVASGRVHLHVSSNAPGRNSGLPYSLRGDAELHVAAPVEWDELGALTPIAAKDFPARLSATGDLFRRQTEAIGLQQLPELEPHRSFDAADSPQHRRPIESHGRILQAAAEILADGKPRDAQTILTEAVARRLLPPDTKQKYVYTALLEYIVRSSGHGHKPFLVQDVDRRFRVNEPLDEWPAADLPPLPPPDAATLALIDRLESTGRGSDPTAFELAVCDAFAHLGFIATHVGGYQNPDGYADAPLGVDGYRTMLECKTGQTVVHDADAVEASKFRDAFGASVCAIVGSDYTEDLELASELQTHAVSAFTVADLQQLLRVRSNPREMRPLFDPGFAADRLGDVLWERLHGAAKRLTLICDYVCQAGWEAQMAYTRSGHPRDVAEAPRLTVDAAMLLIDRCLRDAGSSAACTREEVEAAFARITDAIDGRAYRLPGTLEAIVVAAPAEASDGQDGRSVFAEYAIAGSYG